jgi:transcriptional regulator with XRE-family HTH domain
MANLTDSRTSRLSSGAQLRHKRGIVYRGPPEAALAEMMRSAERLDVAYEVVHEHHMRRIYPSGQVSGDGFVRKLCRIGPSWDKAAMADPDFDIERIKDVLRKATGPGAEFSQRSLAKEAEEGRDTVGDILNGRNKNPTSKVLSNLARALGGDLSMFGLAEERGDPPTEAELYGALLDAIPQMPKQGTTDKRARFLSEAVARVLKLPQVRQSSGGRSRPSEGATDAPPPAPTN